MRELEPGGPAAESRPAARCRGPSHGPAKGPACFPRNPACGDGRRRPGGVSSPAKSRAATGVESSGDDSERVRVPAADAVRARRCPGPPRPRLSRRPARPAAQSPGRLGPTPSEPPSGVGGRPRAVCGLGRFRAGLGRKLVLGRLLLAFPAAARAGGNRQGWGSNGVGRVAGLALVGGARGAGDWSATL